MLAVITTTRITYWNWQQNVRRLWIAQFSHALLLDERKIKLRNQFYQKHLIFDSNFTGEELKPVIAYCFFASAEGEEMSSASIANAIAFDKGVLGMV